MELAPLGFGQHDGCANIGSARPSPSTISTEPDAAARSRMPTRSSTPTRPPASCSAMTARCCARRESRALHPGQLPALIVFTEAVIAKGSYWTTRLHAAPRRRPACCGWNISAACRMTVGALIAADRMQRSRRAHAAALIDPRSRSLHAQRASRNGSGSSAISGHRAREPADPARRRRRHLRRQRRGKTTFVNPAAERMLGWSRRRTGRRGDPSDRAPQSSRRQPLPGRGLPDLCRVPRRRRAQGRQRGVLAQGRLAASGSNTPRPRSAIAACWSAP